VCRRCARVGVETRPERIQAMVAGVPVADDEFTDVNFALIATQINRERRAAKFKGYAAGAPTRSSSRAWCSSC